MHSSEDSRAVALVTGAANNIGRAIATAFAADHRVVLADLQDATTAAREIGNDAVAVQGDVSEAADCAGWIEAAEGLGPLRVVVHCAGITWPAKAVADMPIEEWEKTIRVNLNGTFILMRTAIPALRRAGEAAAVLISSRAGKTGFAALGANPGATKAHYAASKAGVISLTKSLALELAPDRIRVNCVAPGPIEGAMIPRRQWREVSSRVPLGRLGKPEDVAAAVRFLCSPGAAFITGHVLDVNGGTLMD